MDTRFDNNSYRGGNGEDVVVGTGSADLISGGFGEDSLETGGGADTLTGGDGEDTFIITGYDGPTDIVVITDFEVLDGEGEIVDTLDVVGEVAFDAVGELAFDTRADIGGGAIVLSNGDTIESYEIGEDGSVILYDRNTGNASVDQLYAQTSDDVIAIADSILLNILDLTDGEAGTFLFGLDEDGNGTAESTIVVSSDDLATSGEVNVVKLVGIAFAEGVGVDVGLGIIP